MKTYVIERDIPGVGGFSDETMVEVAKTSNKALDEIGERIKWVESFVTADRTYCIYMAEDESDIHRHSEISGFPANKVSELIRKISPATADG
ncbi:MAG: DUF4242 domain-containing protein [Sphingomonadales bacterium]